MEAIDNYANEHLARSLAYSILELRQQHHFPALVPLASEALKQRILYLHPVSHSDPDEWNSIIQWQEDQCPEQIELLWQTSHRRHQALGDDVYQNPVYFKRFDADTMHVVIPFQQQDDSVFLVILILEQEQTKAENTPQQQEEEPELKYQNTKQIPLQEWQDIESTWSTTLEEAERKYLLNITTKKTGKPHKPEVDEDASAEYWGEWSSDEDQRNDLDKNVDSNTRGEDSDSDDEYYAHWSENPDTLTPGPETTLEPSNYIPSSLQQELDEEYDQSWNPLYTVPSVPNLMDAHSQALEELTNMLQASLPPPPPGASSAANTMRRPPFHVMTSVDPSLPKSLQHPPPFLDDDVQRQHVPGAYPESRTRTPVRSASFGKITPLSMSTTKNNQVQPPVPPAPASSWDDQKKNAGTLLLKKSLHALVGAAKLLGLTSDEINAMTTDVINDSFYN
ncbi:hypothetical protein DM01DRAFT_1315985 [Hesseltinella vesiculosa]|uniref:Uncharacterized protein n=1 Tax=Hesseltinella vesiculosa TaxID=101127 RepID=A0A1X2GTG0_9FUNG|nr:hypothetical protein DM01DRAFT_1315985 [Hesseltinella vesiculosa]